MSKRVSHIGHATAQALLFAGKERELTIDTSKKTVRVHDGVTKGGFELALASAVNIQEATSAVNGIMTAGQVQELAAATAAILVNSGAITVNAAQILLNQQGVATNAADIIINIAAILANTNKLATIESGATADQTKVEIDALGINAVQLQGNAAAAFAKVANNLSDLVSAATARSNLGLGSIATQNSNAVTITGGSIAGVSGIALDSDFVNFTAAFPSGASSPQVSWNTGFGTNDFSWGISAIEYPGTSFLNSIAVARNGNAYHQLTAGDPSALTQPTPTAGGTGIINVDLICANNFSWNVRLWARKNI